MKGIANVCLHIHDGFIIVCNKRKIKQVYEIAKASLESSEDLYKGLVLNTICNYGDNLNELKRYER